MKRPHAAKRLSLFPVVVHKFLFGSGLRCLVHRRALEGWLRNRSVAMAAMNCAKAVLPRTFAMPPILPPNNPNPE